MAKVKILQPVKLPDPETEMGLIDGRSPGSVNEWNFFVGLLKDNIDYIYQYQVGIAGTRGSQEIDFVVFGAGPATAACFIQGSYWHNRVTEGEDRLKHEAARDSFGEGNVFDFTEEETATPEAARAARRKKLGG